MADENQQAQISVIKLRRTDTSQPWGFRMRGGAQQGMPLFIEHIAANGRAAKGGLCQGDGLLMICNTNVTKASHDQAKGEILRAGNELDFTIQKGSCVGLVPTPSSQTPRKGGAMIKTARAMGSMERKVSAGSMSPRGTPEQRVTLSQPYREEPRSEVIEEPSTRFGGPVYKNIIPKSYQMLESQLSHPEDSPEIPSECNPNPDNQPVFVSSRKIVLNFWLSENAKPSSIFDRKRQERSAYLNADGSTIQKAYGQKNW